MNRRRTVALSVAIVSLTVMVSAITLLVLTTQPASSSGSTNALQGDITWPAGKRPAPGFTLRDQQGRRVSLASFRGRPVVVTFLDSRCTNLCPVEGRFLGDVQRMLPPAQRPVILAVSVNPTDTPQSVRRFVDVHAHWTTPWYWLMGTRAQLAPVWKAYAIGVRQVRRKVAGVHFVSIEHTAALYLVDAHGDERSGYLMPFTPRDLADDVRTLDAS
jgi:protein SCO1